MQMSVLLITIAVFKDKMKAEEASPGHSDFFIYIINKNASSSSSPNKSPTAELYFCAVSFSMRLGI